jgi:2-C-methyl-D-erythritol 4-phosphate cytidylyltransferase
MKVSAIVVAAGNGTRLGLQSPKAFVSLAGQALLAYSLRAIGRVAGIDEAIIAAPIGMELATRALVAAAMEIPVKITAGGAERQDSVRLALALTSAEAEVVVVHDAARPFATPALFAAAIVAAAHSGAAIAAMPVADTLKRVDSRTILATVARAGLWQAQTPQAFRREILMRAHERATRERDPATDDAELVERIGSRVAVVDGSALNLKITTPDDLRIAEALAATLFPH